MRRKKLIFILENSFPYYAGGIENWTYNMIMRLCDKYEITIISEQADEQRARLYYNITDKIKLFPYFSFRQFAWYNRFFNHSYFSLIDYKFRKHSMTKKLKQVVRNENKEEIAVIALSTMAASYAANHLKKEYKDVLNVCSSRGPHAEILSKSHPAFRKIIMKSEMQNMESADLILTNGYDTQAYYEKVGIHSIVMKNGVNIKPFFERETESPFTPEKRTILAVGTLWDVKCISELISAFALMNNDGVNDIELVFAGKGDPTKYIAQAEQLGVKEMVYFAGHQSDLIPYYKNATVITCLSGGGGFGMAAIEAMASGRPVIAWDSPVYRQFNTEKQTMVLTEEKNVEKLADALKAVLMNEEKYTEMCKNAQYVAKQFDWSVVVSDFEEIINL